MLNQQTIKKTVSFSGKALQTGYETHVTLKPLEAHSGIIFKRIDLEASPTLRLGEHFFSDFYERRSTVAGETSRVEVQTVEHFLAALWGMGIDNLLVELDNCEMPGLDGSSIEFVKIIKSTGTIEQLFPKKVIKISEEENIKEGSSSLSVLPQDTFSISYTIDYDVRSIGHEVFDITLDRETFEKEIAPARTFCLKKEAMALLASGFGKGANLENTVVLDDTGPMGGMELRFSNEPVRHKILDIVGDFYMLGRPIVGRIIAEKSGHALNRKMVERIYEKYIKG